MEILGRQRAGNEIQKGKALILSSWKELEKCRWEEVDRVRDCRQTVESNKRGGQQLGWTEVREGQSAEDPTANIIIILAGIHSSD